MSTKIHPLVDGGGLPMVVLVGAGQGNDSPMFPVLLGHLRVPRVGPGRPRTHPGRVWAGKARSARAHRALLRARGIGAVIPEPSDQIRNRKRRGAAGGRPPAFDPVDHRGCNVVERASPTSSNGGLATRFDKHAVTYRGAAVLRTISLCLKRLGDTP